MGVQIITGSTVGDSFGKGMLAGIDEKKAEIKEQELADQYVSVVSGMIESQADTVKAGMEPAYTPPATETLSTGKLGGVEVPSYLRPVPNPLEGKADRIAEGLVQSMQGLTDPRAIQLAGTAAAEQLDALAMQEMQARLAGDLRAAAKGGLVEQAEVEMFAGMLEEGEDPMRVYQAFSEVREERAREAVNEKRAVRFMESGRLQEAALRQTADTIVDPDEKAWATAQAQELAAKLDEIEVYASGGIDSFDFDGAVEEVREIKNRLNPYQQQRVEEREVAYREGMDALSRVMTMEDLEPEERAARVNEIRQAFGLDPSAPVAAPAPAAPPAEAPTGETASDRSAAALTPEQQQRDNVKRGAIGLMDGAGFADLDSPEAVDARAVEIIQGVVGRLFPDGEVELSGEGSDLDLWTEAVTKRIEMLAEEDPHFAQLLAGRLVRVLEMAEEAKAGAPAPETGPDSQQAKDSQRFNKAMGEGRGPGRSVRGAWQRGDS